MKNSKLRRALLLLASAVLLVSLSVGATLAYLQDATDAVVNTFTVGSVVIDLDEAKVNVYGEMVNAEGKTKPEDEEEAADWVAADRVKKNSYKLLPGHTYVKDPTIHVEGGSEVCWLFVKVFNDMTDIQDAVSIHDQMVANGWTLLDGYNIEDDECVYWHATVDAREVPEDDTLDVLVFENFKIKGNADVSNRATSEDEDFNLVTITAYAVQADGFNTAQAAWDDTFGLPANP